MRVVAVDPGLTTGVAVYEHGGFSSFEIPGGLLPAVACVRDLLTPNAVLVFEKFVISSSTVKKDLTDAYTALYINGAIQVAAQERQALRVVTQTPAQKEWAKDSFLKALGWYQVGLGGHANDAARHILKYLADSRTLPHELLTKIIDLELN